MAARTIGQVMELLKSWLLHHHMDIIEVILVGSQADLQESDLTSQGSDVDLVILIHDNSDPEQLLSNLALFGLQNSVLFHPLIMTREELTDKQKIPHYRRMIKSGRRVYPDEDVTTGCSFV